MRRERKRGVYEAQGYRDSRNMPSGARGDTSKRKKGVRVSFLDVTNEPDALLPTYPIQKVNLTPFSRM